ncbi:MAG: hypothetical protein CMJ64_20375 [Planctomycetaceae bacterium]|nr:hypothetical protein [Planctomycetaceae bacterium]
MVRIFRPWQKKRGSRRTGSRLAGSVGEAVFFGMLFLLGAVALTTVIVSQILNPTPEVLRPGFGFWLMVVVMASFVLLGGGGVMLTAFQAGASIERRSALVRQAAGIDLISEALPSSQQHPNIPRDADLTNSPGVTLVFRLPTAQMPVWRLTLATLVFLLLTAVTSVVCVIVVNHHLAQTPDWFLTLFAVPLVIANFWAVKYFFTELGVHTRHGPTCFEISHHPLRPNSECEIFVSQAGRFSLPAFTVALVCEEEATYSQGTDIRTETRVVYETEVLRQEDIRIEAGTPFEAHSRLSIPGGVMHSFQSGHNAVRWKFVVRGTPVSGPSMARTFPVLVYPDNQNGQE